MLFQKRPEMQPELAPDGRGRIIVSYSSGQENGSETG